MGGDFLACRIELQYMKAIRRLIIRSKTGGQQQTDEFKKIVDDFVQSWAEWLWLNVSLFC